MDLMTVGLIVGLMPSLRGEKKVVERRLLGLAIVLAGLGG